VPEKLGPVNVGATASVTMTASLRARLRDFCIAGFNFGAFPKRMSRKRALSKLYFPSPQLEVQVSYLIFIPRCPWRLLDELAYGGDKSGANVEILLTVTIEGRFIQENQA
jgi:hypothetical protein